MAYFRRDLCWVGLAAASAEQVLRAMARRLHRLGLVRATFEEALVSREAVWPTALPLPGRKLAIPHADPEHVVAPAIACCTLASPVSFREMGNPDSELAVDVVVLLALSDHQDAQRELVRFLERSQERSFLDRLYACPDPNALRTFLVEEVGG